MVVSRPLLTPDRTAREGGSEIQARQELVNYVRETTQTTQNYEKTRPISPRGSFPPRSPACPHFHDLRFLDAVPVTPATDALVTLNPSSCVTAVVAPLTLCGTTPRVAPGGVMLPRAR